jgi:hypothetical protein
MGKCSTRHTYQQTPELGILPVMVAVTLWALSLVKPLRVSSPEEYLKPYIEKFYKGVSPA